MGLFNRIFGGDDLTKELDKNIDNDIDVDVEAGDNISMDDDDFPPYNTLYGKEKWPYAFKPRETKKLAGRELYTVCDETEEMYMGKDIRDLIEMRRENPKAPTRIGYAKNNIEGMQDVYIDHSALFRHIALFGTTGYGKSTLMKNIMLQWIMAGFGVCYIDPKGADSYELLQTIPPDRLEDVVWVEPGSGRNKQVGFNALDTVHSRGDQEFEREVNSVSGDLIEVMKDNSQGDWGPAIDNITQTLTGELIKADEPFNLIDLLKLLTDEEERKVFAESYGNELNKVFTQQVAESNDESLQAVVRRLQNWLSSSSIRQVIAHPESDINIPNLIENNRILIVNTSHIEDDTQKEIITRMIIQRIWSKIKTRDPDLDPDPFFLCIDEFDKVITDTFDINKIISQARAFRLCVFIANQHPSQLGEDVLSAVQTVQSMMSFHPGNKHGDKQKIANILGDVDTWELDSLDKYTIVGRPYMNESQQSAMTVQTFGEYPPLRDEESVEDIIDYSLKKYGTSANLDKDIDNYGVKRFVEAGDEAHQLNQDGDTVTSEQILECIYTAQLRRETVEIDGEEGWVSINQVKDEVGKYAGEISSSYISNFSNLLEQFTERELRRRVSDKAYFKLGNEGLRRAFEPDTGSAASGGKSAHRVLLREGHKSFTKLGYDVRLPTQNESGALPDGVADPPIAPVEESSTFDEAVEKEKELVKKYPRLAQLFGDKQVSIEAESTTITRPAQTIKNLIKSVKKNNHCVFLVKDGSRKHDDFTYWARLGSNILTDPPFVRSIDEHGNRTFYTTNNKIELSNGSRPLVSKDVGELSWSEKGKQHTKNPEEDDSMLVLNASNEDEPLVTFDEKIGIIKNPAPEKFPYYYYRDTASEETVIQDREGNVVDRYDNLSEMKTDGKYKSVYTPIIPEFEFDDGEIPDKDQWTFVIISESENRGPQIYENGETKPLLVEHGAKIDPEGFENMKIDIDADELISKEKIKSDFSDIIDKPDQETKSESKDSIEEEEDEDEDDGVDPTEFMGNISSDLDDSRNKNNTDSVEQEDENNITDKVLNEDNMKDSSDNSDTDDGSISEDEEELDIDELLEFPDKKTKDKD